MKEKTEVKKIQFCRWREKRREEGIMDVSDCVVREKKGKIK